MEEQQFCAGSASAFGLAALGLGLREPDREMNIELKGTIKIIKIKDGVESSNEFIADIKMSIPINTPIIPMLAGVGKEIIDKLEKQQNNGNENNL